MNAARREQIEERLESVFFDDGSVTFPQADVRALLVHIEALEDALRGLTYDGSEVSEYSKHEFPMCRYCDAALFDGEQHAPDCVWAKAQQMVGGNSAE